MSVCPLYHVRLCPPFSLFTHLSALEQPGAMAAEEVTYRLLYVCARRNDGAFAQAEFCVVYEGHWDMLLGS